MDTIIEFNNVTFEYDSDDRSFNVFEGLSLAFERNSFNVVLGHNGSGKSTLAKLTNGLIKPSAGVVKVNGISTADTEREIEIKRTVGLVFQNPDNQLVSSIVEEDVAFGPENLGYSPEEIRLRVDSALKSVDMYDKRNELTHKLSGGQKQRVAIAGIIAMEPECIVLDEPTAMLDPKGRREVISTVRRLNKEKNITVILITHYMDEAIDADRVIVMSDGEITADGKPETVFLKTDKLRSAGLELPQTTELLSRLSKDGITVEGGALTVNDCAEAIAKLLSLEDKQCRF